MDDIKKLEKDLGGLISQAERENANLSHQLFVRQRIQEVTSQLAQSNAYAIEILTEHMRVITRHAQSMRSADPTSISEQLALQMSQLQ
jgi:hypothetical protein